MSKNRSEPSSKDRRIDSIGLRESDREAVGAHLRHADVVADLFDRAVENLRTNRQTLAPPASATSSAER